MASGFKFDASELFKGLAGAPDKADMAIRMYVEQGALKMQNYAKENRRWTDRTSHARQRLKGYINVLSTGYRISLAHGVDYGIWLELANAGKYSIIPETIEKIGTSEIMPGFERLLDRLGGGSK